jgi:phosphatidylinositol alpha-1,6-mannosyltransferase
VPVSAHNRHVAVALLVSTSFPPGAGGIESYLEGLCRRLGPGVTVLAPATRDGRALPRGLGSRVHGYAGPMVVPGPRVLRAIEAAAAAEGTDRVLFGSPFPLGLIGPRLKERGLRYGVIVHGAEMLVPAAAPGLRRLLVRSLQAAELVLPVSEFTAARVRSLLEAAPPMAVLRAQVDLERFSPSIDSTAALNRIGLRAEDRVILCLGRLVRRKGAHRLLDALPELAASFPDVVVVVAGTGPQGRRLRYRARRVERVVFTGRVAPDDAAELHASASVFALPVVDRWWGLDTEGLGVALLEAQASGVPCVTGRSGGTPEAVVDGETGFVVDARNRSELVQALAYLLGNREAARAMGAAGREHVARNFAAQPLPRLLLDWLGYAPYDA